ncbi:MAG: NYN domain-containing protein [Flavobacteriales bacterium]|nr:NYN domain-containing protein [Flavobacteriales bacterium]MCL4856382.1 NYN domain-containing protein [Flavobacteriales bacterium]
MDKKRVIAYFDGFNYYEALRSKKWRHYYWQDLFKFSELFLRKHQQLDKVRLFTAIQQDPDKSDRQDKWLQANKLNDKFNVTYGEFKKRHKWKRVECNNCSKKDNYKIEYWEEKKTDVSLASYIIRDVALNECDVIFLFCADSDLSLCIDLAREINPLIKIVIFFPPGIFSSDLNNKASNVIRLENHEQKFKKSIMPLSITNTDGYILNCPEKWLPKENK